MIKMSAELTGPKVKHFEAKRLMDFLPPDKLSVCQKAQVRKEKKRALAPSRLTRTSTRTCWPCLLLHISQQLI